MPLSSDEVRHIATLARLGLSDAEVVSLAEELDVILEHVSRLATIDVAGVPETARIGGLVNAWRDDASRPSLPAKAALANAPGREGDYFAVGAIQE